MRRYLRAYLACCPAQFWGMVLHQEHPGAPPILAVKPAAMVDLVQWTLEVTAAPEDIPWLLAMHARLWRDLDERRLDELGDSF